MKRRDVLKWGAVAGVGGSGCATLSSSASFEGDGMESFLSTLDNALAATNGGGLLARFSGAKPPPRHAEELIQKTLRSLLLVGALHDLTPEQIAHEGMQRRLRDSMTEFDDSMFGMTSMLESMTPADHAEVSAALRDDPGLVMRIMGALDEEAAALGISFNQRAKLRRISSLACARLRQSPALTIAEYTGKARKIAARHGAREEAQRGAAASLSSALLWQGQGDQATSVGGTLDGGVDEGITPPPLVAPGNCASSDDCGSNEACVGYRRLTDGTWTRGVCTPRAAQSPPVVTPRPPRDPWAGAGFLVAGGVVLGLAVVGAIITTRIHPLVGTTVGAVLGVVGIVLFIIGLARSAR